MADAPADTPALDALLREVDKNSLVPVAHTFGSSESIPEWLAASMAQFSAAPRLAAIVRVLVEAVSANLDSSNVVPSKVPGWRMVSAEVLSMARTALARAEAIARGEA